jgi:dTMP kinase
VTRGWPFRRRPTVLRGELLPPAAEVPAPPPQDEQPTEPVESVPVDRDLSGPRLLGSSSFFRLWLAQVVSSLGDWIGLVAVLSLAARIGGRSPEAAVGIVMSARMVPGFFFGSVGGVLVDRWDRKRVMVTCDVGRGFVLATLPFIHTIAGLFVASLLLELLTLLWSPAKEASVPNLVETSRLTTANSLSLAAAYGTFPIGSALFASLTKVAEFLGNHAGPLKFLELNQESLAIYVDVLTFFTSAALIATLALSRNERQGGRVDLGRTFTELKEGWRFIGSSPIVRSVLVGLGTGLIGGGMVAPLGPTFANRILHAGPPGFGLLLTALGTGLAVGVITLSAVQKRIPHAKVFPPAVLGAGAAMMAAATMSSLGLTMLFIAAMGVCAGAVYVLGFTLLQENVSDDLRGRIFATLYTLSRLCLLISLTLAPLLAGLLDGVTPIAGVRLTLWLGAGIILVAGVLATRALDW